MARSTDDGRSWSEPRVLPVPDGYDSPQPLYDATAGAILVVLTLSYPDDAPGPAVRRCSRCTRGIIRSEDAGLTWASLEPMVAAPGVLNGGLAFDGQGLAHGVQLAPNAHLAVTQRSNRCRDDCRQSPPTSRKFNFVALSSDHGATWTASTPLPPHMAGESVICQLRNGSLLLSSARKPHGFARSDNGGRTWASTWQSDIYGGTEASLLCPPWSDVAYFATPASFYAANNHNRVNLTIYASDDFGRSWSTAALAYNGLGAYSDMAWLTGRGGIGVLFERGHDDMQTCHGMCYVAVSFVFVPIRAAFNSTGTHDDLDA